MGAKPALERVTEPDENMVHYVAAPSMGGLVSLCGLTDFIHAKKKGSATREPVTCRACIGIVKYIHEHAKP